LTVNLPVSVITISAAIGPSVPTGQAGGRRCKHRARLTALCIWSRCLWHKPPWHQRSTS